MILVFLDSETTGLNFKKHRLIEIAFKAIDSETGRTLCSYETLINQPREIFAAADPTSVKINGITFEEILDGKSERVVATEIIQILNHLGFSEKSGVFICQNPSFDRFFFCQLIDVDLQDRLKWPYHWLDLASMYLAVRQVNDKLSIKKIKEKGLSKDSIANYFGLAPEEQPHRAMNGVNHLIACYEAMFGAFAQLAKQ